MLATCGGKRTHGFVHGLVGELEAAEVRCDAHARLQVDVREHASSGFMCWSRMNQRGS